MALEGGSSSNNAGGQLTSKYRISPVVVSTTASSDRLRDPVERAKLIDAHKPTDAKISRISDPSRQGSLSIFAEDHRSYNLLLDRTKWNNSGDLQFSPRISDAFSVAETHYKTCPSKNTRKCHSRRDYKKRYLAQRCPQNHKW